MDKKFRLLEAEEIECRVSTVKESGVSLLLYKDARCDMNILDETVGAMNWKRSHLRDNANCVVEIWDNDKSQWISKEDTGAESFTSVMFNVTYVAALVFIPSLTLSWRWWVLLVS